MREIKFRAWDKQSKRMIVDKQDFIPLIVTSAGVFRLSATHDDALYSLVEPERFELMQYTGIKDKNGIEIYEGDIVRLTYIRCEGGGWKSNSKEQGEVYFDSTWGVKFDCKDMTQRTADTHWKVKAGSFDDAIDVEVVGNIHQKPELLEWRQ